MFSLQCWGGYSAIPFCHIYIFSNLYVIGLLAKHSLTFIFTHLADTSRQSNLQGRDITTFSWNAVQRCFQRLLGRGPGQKSFGTGRWEQSLDIHMLMTAGLQTKSCNLFQVLQHSLTQCRIFLAAWHHCWLLREPNIDSNFIIQLVADIKRMGSPHKHIISPSSPFAGACLFAVYFTVYHPEELGQKALFWEASLSSNVLQAFTHSHMGTNVYRQTPVIPTVSDCVCVCERILQPLVSW